MTITIPEEFKDTYCDRKLYLARKNVTSFIILTEEEKDVLDKRFSELGDNPDKVAFNRFLLSGITETKSVGNLLDLPKAFEDFSEGKISFSFESKSILVSKIESMRIVIPEEFKDTLWGRNLFITRKGYDTFLIYDYDVKDTVSKAMSKVPKSDAFIRFMLANTFETKSVDDLLELPEELKDFYDCKVSFLNEKYCVSVTKV